MLPDKSDHVRGFLTCLFGLFGFMFGLLLALTNSLNNVETLLVSILSAAVGFIGATLLNDWIEYELDVSAAKKARKKK
tara:strand:+ start:9937 stop:10170 length:234 start_codon:yes stop_codon:yes gene_type:complete